MKKLLLLAVFAVGAVSCSVENVSENDAILERNSIYDLDDVTLCGENTTHLYPNNLGKVDVNNDAETLYVTITSTEADNLKNTRFAWAANFEGFGSNNGTLPPGKMDQKGDEHNVTTYTFTVPLTDLPAATVENPEVCILIAVWSIFGANEGEHWAGDQNAGTAGWKYFEYCVQTCPPIVDEPVIVCETAYMATGTTLVDFYKETISSNNWGWYLYYDPAVYGEDETFDIYAAAGQNILEKGFKVGTVTVRSDGSHQINLDSQYTAAETHVYRGNSLPSKRPAPGRYTRSSFSNGTFYMIIHLNVCWEE